MKQRHTQHWSWFIGEPAHHHHIAPDSCVIWDLRLSKLTTVRFWCCFFKEFPITGDTPWQAVVIADASILCQSRSHKDERLSLISCHLDQSVWKENTARGSASFKHHIHTQQMAWIWPIKCMHIQHKTSGNQIHVSSKLSVVLVRDDCQHTYFTLCSSLVKETKNRKV